MVVSAEVRSSPSQATFAVKVSSEPAWRCQSTRQSAKLPATCWPTTIPIAASLSIGRRKAGQSSRKRRFAGISTPGRSVRDKGASRFDFSSLEEVPPGSDGVSCNGDQVAWVRERRGGPRRICQAMNQRRLTPLTCDPRRPRLAKRVVRLRRPSATSKQNSDRLTLANVHEQSKEVAISPARAPTNQATQDRAVR